MYRLALMCVYYNRLGNLPECEKMLSEAIVRCNSEMDQNPQYYGSIAITIKYNMGRLHEVFCRFSNAEKIYKDILNEYASYVDCE